VGLVVILHLGVFDIPYEKDAPRRVAVHTPRPGGKPRKLSAPAAGGETTGDVAEILEAKYHVMQHFWDTCGSEVCDALTEDMMDAFADRASGRNIDTPDFTAATSKMHQMFNEFIDRRGMDGMELGVPTMAARLGINHRFLHPYAKANPERPSFKDTGTYAASMLAWIES
jgi:hypothetical protein